MSSTKTMRSAHAETRDAPAPSKAAPDRRDTPARRADDAPTDASRARGDGGYVSLRSAPPFEISREGGGVVVTSSSWPAGDDSEPDDDEDAFLYQPCCVG